MTTSCYQSLLRNIRCAVPFALALLLVSTASGEEGEWGIDQLMEAMQQTRSDHATFTERKSIAMLEEPVVSSGELFYTAPDRMEKRTLKPRPESMILDRDTLVMQRGKKKRSLRVQDAPELAAFIESVRGILAGDRDALERHYQLTLEGIADDWALQLTPLDEKILRVISTIRITGAGNTVRSIETLQADGDSSLMLIERIAVP